MKYGLGLDLSKDKIHACLGGFTLEQAFKIIAQRSFANTEKGHVELNTWLAQKRKDKTLAWQIVVEVTGVYHEEVLYYLHAQGYPVCLELSKRVKKYLESIGQISKNDKLDGQGLAQLACERKLPLWQPICPQILAIRTLLRHRKALIITRDQFKNQLHALNHSAMEERTVKRSLQQLIKQLDKKIDQAMVKAEELAKKEEAFYKKLCQIVDSVSGLGVLSVLSVVAETNGFENFSSCKQLVSYAGYDVKENSSGQFTGKTRISKQGNARLRSALYMPALCMIRQKAEPFYSFYYRLLLRNGGLKKKAQVAVQRKLLILIYTLWKKDEPFDKNYHLTLKNQNNDIAATKTSSPDVTSELQWIENSF